GGRSGFRRWRGLRRFSSNPSLGGGSGLDFLVLRRGFVGDGAIVRTTILSIPRLRRRLLRRLIPRRARGEHRPPTPFPAPWALALCRALQLRDNLVQQHSAQFWVSHLAPTEEHRHLDLVALGQELLDLAHLHVEVVVVRARAHADFLQLRHLLVLARLIFLLGLLILVATPVHKASDRRHRHRRYLDQSELAL